MIHRCLPFVLIFLGACSSGVKAPVTSPNQVPVENRTTVIRAQPAVRETDGVHVVRSGDTLYAIAWKYSRDYREVASWNNIKSPYTIYPGQRIKIQPETGTSKSSSAGRQSTQRRNNTRPTIIKQRPALSLPPGQKPNPPTDEREDEVMNGSAPVNPAWRWPTEGKLVRLDTPTMEKGANISGKAGQPVLAAADGEIVYSGSGLLGYGKLIIIKHNATYLSAYAHNHEIFKSEGNRVKSGEMIATMGTLTDGLPILNFEIRKNGKVVDPMGYLPKK
jgi:lipoprotein NlpD